MSEESELLDMEQTARSLNGWEEIAVEKFFDKAFTDLKGTATARAILFIVEKRAGKVDVDAFRSVMLMTIDELEGRFEKPDETESLVEDEGKA